MGLIPSPLSVTIAAGIGVPVESATTPEKVATSEEAWIGGHGVRQARSAAAETITLRVLIIVTSRAPGKAPDSRRDPGIRGTSRVTCYRLSAREGQRGR